MGKSKKNIFLYAGTLVVFSLVLLYFGIVEANFIYEPQVHLDTSTKIFPNYSSAMVIAQFESESAPRPSGPPGGGHPSIDSREYVPSDPDVLYIARKKSLSEVREKRDYWYERFLSTQSRSAYTRYKKYDQALKFKQDKCIEQRRTGEKSIYCF